MNKFAIGLAAALASTAAVAQTPMTPTRPVPAPVVTTTPGAPVPAAPGVNTSTGTSASAPMVGRNTGTAAAAGDRNQAVATTSANAPQPARGHTSFTMGEARRRLTKAGYTTVADLKKDGNGVWRGTGMKDGASTGVWLDYKGNMGQQ